MGEMIVEAFGLFAITVMIASYALESRGPLYIAAFAVGCGLAAFYALLVGAYPFVVAEAIWAFVAFRRFRLQCSELAALQ